jgi:hypothetical protein
VRITIGARALHAKAAKFSAAYATNEVGNSGWRSFLAGEEWGSFDFTYPVSPAIKGNGDYIGILPDVPGAPGIEVTFVAAQVIDRDKQD